MHQVRGIKFVQQSNGRGNEAGSASVGLECRVSVSPFRGQGVKAGAKDVCGVSRHLSCFFHNPLSMELLEKSFQSVHMQ